MPKDKDLAAIAEEFKNRYAALLKQATVLADKTLSESALASRQYVTPYTLEAERMTSFFTGIPIDHSITIQQKSIQPTDSQLILPRADERIKELSNTAYRLTTQLADFKKKLLLDVVKCKTYSAIYPMEIHHMWEEADKFLKMLEELDAGKNIMCLDTLKKSVTFFAQIMSGHSRFTASRLDPYEASLFQNALFYAEEFDSLVSRANYAQQRPDPDPELTKKILSAAKRLQDFQIQCTSGIMDCSIQSLILPLRSDHHMRETYFFIWLLEMAQKSVY